MHQSNCLACPSGTKNLHGPFGIPLHQFALIRMQKYSPLFDVFAEDLLKVLLVLDQHQIHIGHISQMAKVTWSRWLLDFIQTAEHLIESIIQGHSGGNAE